MANCARCGSKGAGPPTLNRHIGYDYCDECNTIFEEAKEHGVEVRSRHSNEAFNELPYIVSVNAEGIESPHAHSVNSSNKPENQTEALAMAKQVMEKHDLPGVFIYQKTGSVWLIDEYLEAHPGIKEDVDKENSGFLSRFF